MSFSRSSVLSLPLSLSLSLCLSLCGQACHYSLPLSVSRLVSSRPISSRRLVWPVRSFLSRSPSRHQLIISCCASPSPPSISSCPLFSFYSFCNSDLLFMEGVLQKRKARRPREGKARLHERGKSNGEREGDGWDYAFED